MGTDSFFRKHILPYFIFSKGERHGIIFLLFLLNLAWVIPVLLPEKSISLPAEELILIDSARRAWAMDSSRPASRYRANEKLAGRNPAAPAASMGFTVRKLYEHFDPNTATEDTWLATGIPPRTVRTIMRYLEKGGRFRSPEDLRKIYGLSEQDFLSIRPWIRIKTESDAGGDKGFRTGDLNVNLKPGVNSRSSVDTARASAYRSIALKNGTRTRLGRVLEINSADSADWESLPGIGPVLARRIVQFRSGLGGFSSVYQVREVYGLEDSIYRSIVPRLRMDEEIRPVPIDINQASLEIMGKHPYISRKLAGLIVAYRKQHGPFEKAEDLLAIPLVTEDLLNRLRPYLSLN